MHAESKGFQTLNWFPSQMPQITEILTTHSSSLQLIQSDAVVLRQVSTQRKLDLREVTVYIDKTDLGLRAHNVKKSLRLLSENEINFHSQFSSCSDCHNEYIGKDYLTFDECSSNCAAHKSVMLDNLELLPELKKTFEHGLNQIWLKTQQKAFSDGFYAANYEIKVGGYSILPTNTYSTKERKTRCYMAEKSIFSPVECSSLPAKVRYFQQTNESYQFYHQNFFRLNVLLNMDTSYDLSFEMGQTDLSFGNFQRHNAVFEIYLATPQDVLVPNNARHKCMCWRQKSLSPSMNMLKSKIDTLVHKSVQIKADVERERVRNHGKLAQSNGRHILSRSTDIFSRQPLDKYLSWADIHPLQLNASLSVLTQTIKEKTLPSILNRIGKNLHLSNMLSGEQKVNQVDQKRKRRGLPLTALLGLIKITGPYLLEQSPSIMEFLKKKLKGRLWKSSPVPTPRGNMTSFLSQDLGQNALIEAKFDRLFFSFKSNQTFTLSPANMTMLDKQIIDKFDNAVDQLRFYEREIEANLVPHVFQLLLPRLKGQLREGGQVLSTVSSSKSFSQIKFIFETVLPTAVTHVSLVSLPHRMEGENLYNLAVSNSSFDLYSTETIQDSFSSYNCQNRLFGDQPAPLLKVCTEQVWLTQEVEKVMSLASLQLWLFRGPAQLSYQCRVQPRGHMDLIKDFNLVLVHQSCHLKGRLRNGKDFNKPPMEGSSQDNFKNMQAILLLHYGLVEMSPFNEKVTIWLGVIGGTVIMLTLVLLAIIGYVLIWKGNWSTRIANAVVDIEQADNTELRFKRSTSPPSVGVSQSRSISPNEYHPLNQLPKDMKQAEEALERAMHRDQIRRMDDQTLKEIFPHLSTDSGIAAHSATPMQPTTSPVPRFTSVKYATVQRPVQTTICRI